MSVKTNTTQDHPLIVAYRDAITKYESATTAGVKAGARRAIDNLALEMVVESVPFTPWDPPHKSSAKRPSRNDAELMARIDTIRQIRDDSQHSQSIRDTAARQFDQLVKQATARGLLSEGTPTEEETPETPKTTKRTRNSAGDQLDAINAKVAA
jgi:hypothetical protein